MAAFERLLVPGRIGKAIALDAQRLRLREAFEADAVLREFLDDLRPAAGTTYAAGSCTDSVANRSRKNGTS